MTYKAKAPPKSTDQTGFRPKRFWTAATIVSAAGGHEIHLDGRPVKTPMGAVLTLPGEALAQQVRAEWDAVDKLIEFAAMPLTRLGFAAIDRMPKVVADTLAEVRRYAETDLLCYPSEYPEALVRREDAAWQPVLDWADAELGLVFVQNRTLISPASAA